MYYILYKDRRRRFLRHRGDVCVYHCWQYNIYFKVNRVRCCSPAAPSSPCVSRYYYYFFFFYEWCTAECKQWNFSVLIMHHYTVCVYIDTTMYMFGFSALLFSLPRRTAPSHRGRPRLISTNGTWRNTHKNIIICVRICFRLLSVCIAYVRGGVTLRNIENV